MTDAKKKKNLCPPKNRRAEKGKIFAFNNGSLYKHLPKSRTNSVEVLYLCFDLLFIEVPTGAGITGWKVIILPCLLLPKCVCELQ